MMTYQDYLAHHGIEGMKWGKRNGPPYPLNADQMTAKERAKNEISEYAAKAKVARHKQRLSVKATKLKEREQVRKNKFQEKEERRKTMVREKEERRQNKVDEKEGIRQHRVNESEDSRQKAASEAESYRQFRSGKKYVTKALISIGATALIGYTVYRGIKSGQGNKAAVQNIQVNKAAGASGQNIKLKAAADYVNKSGKKYVSKAIKNWR